MKKPTLTLAFLFAACALTFAGTLQYSGKDKEVAPQPVVETSCFEGWYFGVHAGGLLSNFNSGSAADESSLGADGNGFVAASGLSDNEHNGGAAQGGLHAGHNWQHGGWIFGFEVDLSATGLDEHTDALAITDLPNDFMPYTTTIEARASVDWYSTERLRFGHTLGQKVYVYGTGGLAFGMADFQERTSVFSARDNDQFQFFDRAAGTDSDRGVKFGWTVGGGIDFCVTPHVILNFTYLYVDLEDSEVGNDISFVGSGPPRTFDTHTIAGSDNNFHVFQGGVSLKF